MHSLVFYPIVLTNTLGGLRADRILIFFFKSDMLILGELSCSMMLFLIIVRPNSFFFGE